MLSAVISDKTTLIRVFFQRFELFKVALFFNIFPTFPVLRVAKNATLGLFYSAPTIVAC